MVLFLDSPVRFPVSFGMMPVLPWGDQDLILVPIPALYITQKHSGCNLLERVRGDFTKTLHLPDDKSFIPRTLRLIQLRDHFRSKRSQASVYKLRQRDTLACLSLQVLSPASAVSPKGTTRENSSAGRWGSSVLLQIPAICSSSFQEQEWLNSHCSMRTRTGAPMWCRGPSSAQLTRTFCFHTWTEISGYHSENSAACWNSLPSPAGHAKQDPVLNKMQC